MEEILDKPFSQACENNKAPILAQLAPLLAKSTRVLEVGSGTGQHAVHFAPHMPHLRWQTSDRADNLPGINLWLNDHPQDNLPAPLELDVNQPNWPSEAFDAVFSANTAHIMPWISVVVMINRIGELLSANGLFILYGPFRYEGNFTTESNRRFDEWLKSQGRHQGVRDFEKLVDVAKNAGLEFEQGLAMPANNHMLVWKKRKA